MRKLTLSIIYVYFNTPAEIINSIKSLETALSIGKYEIIIVNNNSAKPLPGSIRNLYPIKILNNNENYGFGTAVNQGVKLSNGKYILITNPDTIFLNNSIDLLIKKIGNDKKIGVIGPQLINPEGKVLHTIASMPNLPDVLFALSFINRIWPYNKYSRRYWGIGIDRNKEQETGTVGGAVMLLRKLTFVKIGGFDERFFLYFEEADLCRRLSNSGYKIVYFPLAKAIHLVGRSTSNKKFIKKHYEKSRYLFLKKYYGFLLALCSETFLRSSSFVSQKVGSIIKL